MNYLLQHIICIEDKLVTSSPIERPQSNKRIAIIAHVFYIDLWEEINNYLNDIVIDFDIYLTVPIDMNDEDIKKIFKAQENAILYKVENRGRDVLPFLQVMNLIPHNSYTYICKLHTKKTGDSPLGNVWRKLLYFDLIGSNETVQKIISSFEKESQIGIITGKNTILDSQRYAYGNDDKIDYLAEKSEMIYNAYYLFPAGTMFWIRHDILIPLITLFRSGHLEFEEEKGQKDDTLAHAIERFFGILCQEMGKSLHPSPADYHSLDVETIEALANLVLGQQYAGLDMFVKQKQVIATIPKKDEYIKYLEELAESMRIKNRLKRIFSTLRFKPNTNTLVQMIKNIKNNPQILKKGFYYLLHGDFAYLWNKVKEKNNKNLQESMSLLEIFPSRYFTTFKQNQYTIDGLIIDIIIPVYNGYEFLEKLFDSLEKNTTTAYRLIVVNDASPDERVKPYLLQRLEKHPNSLFINHEVNQGFLKSVNEAYENISNHFIILNTDTEVPEYWVERLMYPILQMNNIASTTPFTNSGEIASFPNFVADNSIFDHMDVTSLDNVFKNVNASNFYEEVPTGVGFCMGVNYTLTKQIGMFVEDTFGKGYGEENDWCQCAIQEGYKNLLVPNLFVYHKHGGSFSAEEKAKLLKENAIKLLNRHPNYGKDVDTYIKKDPHKTLRYLLVLLAADGKKGTYVIFDHDLGGGANIYADERIDAYKKMHHNILYIKYDFYTDTYKIFHTYKKYHFTFKLTSLQELIYLLDMLRIQELFINSLVSYKEPLSFTKYLIEKIEKSSLKLIIPIHDYYTLCPSYTLLNHKGNYCEIPDLKTCQICMSQNTQEWRNYHSDAVNMHLWRRDWLDLLELSHEILCFSSTSKEILLKAYPTLSSKNIQVIPHRVKPLTPVIPMPKNKKNITLGILGAINYAKGSQITKQLIQTIERNKLDINIVLIGTMSENIKSAHFRTIGRYNRDDLPQIVTDEAIDMFIIPSIWPETFSYTTQEIMMMEMPLMVFDIGAPAERVNQYDKGYIVSTISAEAIIEMLENIFSKENI